MPDLSRRRQLMPGGGSRTSSPNIWDRGPLGNAAENWVNPLSRRFTQVATCVERQQCGLTQFSDSTQLVMSLRRKYQKANHTATMAYPIDHNAPVIMSERSTVGARASRQAYA